MNPRPIPQEIRRAARALDRAHRQLTGRPAIKPNAAPRAKDTNIVVWPPRMEHAPCADGKAVLLPDFGLMFSAEAPLKANSWNEAKKLTSEYRLLGYDDWRLPECHELELLIRRDRSQPAIDTEFFPHTPTNDWYWSATAYAPSPSDYAWGVGFANGFVGYAITLRYCGFVRPVRRVSSGQ